MTVDEFMEMLYFNEPDFCYNGCMYSICHPKEQFYVSEEENPEANELVFDSVEDLLDNWMIQGKPLREIIPNIEWD